MIQRLELRNYSPGTIKAYANAVSQLERFAGQSADQLEPRQVQDFIHYLVKKRGLAWNTIQAMVYGLKYFYHEILERPKERFYIPVPKQEKRLPVIWSPEEIRLLVSTAPNLQTQTMILTTYSTGMRSSEVVHLRVADIDSDHMTLWIRQGKGKKDRAGLLTPSLLTRLRMYWRSYRPSDWMFPSSKNPSLPMRTDTFSSRFIEIKRKAGFKRPGSVHTLRHSFATHLIAQGIDVDIVRKLLGHTKLSTTLIYCHLAQSIVLSKAKNLDLLLLKTLKN